MPADLVRLAERGYGLAGSGYAALEQVLGLVPRAAELVGQLERIAARAEAALDGLDRTRQRADELVDRAGGVIGETDRVLTAAAEMVRRTERLLSGTDELLSGAGQVTKRADVLIGETGQVVTGAQQLTGEAGQLLGRFGPTLSRLAPLADRLAETTSPAEVDAVVGLIDLLPELVDRIRQEILPILASMTNVAPDIRELLETTQEFAEVLGSLPGLGRIKRRVEERHEEHEAERAEIEAAVDRR
jgi:ABC-type transporter Mla subunit MlaD